MRKCIWVLVLDACLVLTAVSASQAQSRNLEIYWIDVEGGAATLIVSPSGQSLLVDAGWPGDRDPKRIVATAKAAGLNTIDILVTTHYHADHVGGTPTLAKLIPIEKFYDHGESIDNVPTSANLDGLCVNQGFEVRGCDTRVVTMGCSVLLVFKERPSFEGELSISLNEECDSQGHKKYFVVCQKKPPLNAKEFAIFAASLNRMDGQALEVITESINWQREVSPSEAKKLTAAMEHQAVSVAPEGVLGLDGTTYELLIERGFNKTQFTWWGEPPAAWRPLRKLSNTLLGVADAASRIEHLQSNTRKRLIQQLQEQLEEEQAKLNSQTSELTKTNNKRCLELAESLSKAGPTCPNCGVLSSDIRFVDKSTAGRSYFICQACGRSFRPEDL